MTYDIELLRKMVSKRHRSQITPEFVEKLEHLSDNPDLAKAFKDNFITYIGVVQEGKYSLDEYISAVKYVTLKMLGWTNISAYGAVFPDRFKRLKESGQQIDAFASVYNKTKLVTSIYQQTLVPSYVLNQPLYQEALNTLAEVIRDPNIRGMAKVKACEAILNATKQPDIIEGKLNISVDQSNTLAELREITEKMADTFRVAVANKTASLATVTNTNIIEADYKEEKDD